MGNSFANAERACRVSGCGEVTSSELINVQSVVVDRWRQETAKRHCERIKGAEAVLADDHYRQ
jgi:RPA family protein